MKKVIVLSTVILLIMSGCKKEEQQRYEYPVPIMTSSPPQGQTAEKDPEDLEYNEELRIFYLALSDSSTGRFSFKTSFFPIYKSSTSPFFLSVTNQNTISRLIYWKPVNTLDYDFALTSQFINEVDKTLEQKHQNGLRWVILQMLIKRGETSLEYNWSVYKFPATTDGDEIQNYIP